MLVHLQWWKLLKVYQIDFHEKNCFWSVLFCMVCIRQLAARKFWSGQQLLLLSTLVNSLVPFLYFDVQTGKKEILATCLSETMWWLCKSEYLQRSVWSLCTVSCPVIALSFFPVTVANVSSALSSWGEGKETGCWLLTHCVRKAGVILQSGVFMNSAIWSGSRDAVYKRRSNPKKPRTCCF